MIKQTNDKYFVKVKLYLTTHVLLSGEKEPINKQSIMDFYNYCKEGTELRLVFGVGRMFEINQEYGFTPYAFRVQLKEAPRNTTAFTDSD